MVSWAAIASAALLALSGLSVAHEDDPKALSQLRPVPGSGYVCGLPASAILPGGGSNTTLQAGSGFDSLGVTLHSWLTIPGPTSTWRDIRTYADRAYAVSEGGEGIQVIDLSNVDSGVVSLENTVLTGGSLSSHNVVIDETSGFLYRCGGGSDIGLRIYDLSNPSSPQFVGDWLVRDAVGGASTSNFSEGYVITFE